MHPITVLNLCEHFGGREASLHGVARSFQWWLPRFDTRRFRVLLASRKGRDAAGAEMEQAGIRPFYLGVGKLDPRNLVRLIRLARRERADILHAHGFGSSMWARLAGRTLGLPVIVHGRCNYGTVPWVMRPVERLLGPGTRYALAVSESTRQFTIQKRHIPADRVEVLYNGIPMEEVPRADSAWIRALRTELGAEPGTLVCGIVGRLVSHKGHLDALEAMASIRSTCPHAQLWIVGDGDFGPTLRAWVERHRAAGWVRFLGFRSDARKVIQAFDVQIFPSHMEGTPNTLYEAMAVGLPAIASRADGQAEILTDGEQALLYDAGDVDALARGLTRLLGDPELRRTLGEGMRALRDRYDGRRTIEALEALYIRIMRDMFPNRPIPG
jgi:glycosyltransferase involved in cell wall biosynthesis